MNHNAGIWIDHKRAVIVWAKLELKARLARSKVLSTRPVEIETTDKLTDPQILAKVKAHFETR